MKHTYESVIVYDDTVKSEIEKKVIAVIILEDKTKDDIEKIFWNVKESMPGEWTWENLKEAIPKEWIVSLDEVSDGSITFVSI